MIPFRVTTTRAGYRRIHGFVYLGLILTVATWFESSWKIASGWNPARVAFYSLSPLSNTVRHTLRDVPSSVTDTSANDYYFEMRQTTFRFQTHLHVGVPLSSISSKAPAPTDWVILEEYPEIHGDGIDPYRILETLKATDDPQGVEKYSSALDRLKITAKNTSLPIALMALDPSRYPSLSNARKACRQGKIILSASTNHHPLPKYRKGLVGDRVYPHDKIARRELYKNMISTEDDESTTSYNTLGDGFVKSKFQNLPVAYEDDFMAIVVKPAGLLVHPQGKNGSWGRKNNVLNALPYFLKKPSSKHEEDPNATGDCDILAKPVPVHRLDFATSGLLVAAKTRGASRLLAQEFEYRKAQKTYTAMVFGIPVADKDDMEPRSFSGRDVEDTNEWQDDGQWERDDDDVSSYIDERFKDWNLADCYLDNKRATTYWRLIGSHNCTIPIEYNNMDSKKADVVDIPISIVEMKPKSGRYHQLRRTMAWLYKTPIVGDSIYASDFVQNNFVPDGATLLEGKQLRDYSASLMLCSNEVDVSHPYYNTPSGRMEWKSMKKPTDLSTMAADKTLSSSSNLYETEDEEVRVIATIKLPKKFTKFIDMMERKKKNLSSRN